MSPTYDKKNHPHHWTLKFKYMRYDIVMLDTLNPFFRTGSGLVHLCGRSSLGTCEGPVAWHHHPPLMGWERGGRTVILYSRILAPSYTGRGTRLVPPCSRPWRPTTGGLTCTLLYFLFRLVPLLSSPLSWSQVPSFVPKWRSQQGVVSLRVWKTLIFLLKTPPFIGPAMSLIGQLHIKWPTCHFQLHNISSLL